MLMTSRVYVLSRLQFDWTVISWDCACPRGLLWLKPPGTGQAGRLRTTGAQRQCADVNAGNSLLRRKGQRRPLAFLRWPPGRRIMCGSGRGAAEESAIPGITESASQSAAGVGQGGKPVVLGSQGNL